MAGYVYVLLNPGLPGKVKIGRTDRNPVDRARELSSTGLPHPFVVAYWKLVPDPVAAEAYLHSVFDDYRVSKNREFFDASIVDVIDEIISLDGCIEINTYDVNICVENYVSLNLYWIKLENQPVFCRIGVTDLPQEDLRSAIIEISDFEYPSSNMIFGEPKFLKIKNRDMGNEIIGEVKSRGVKNMPGFYSGISFNDLNYIYQGYNNRVSARDEVNEIERREIERISRIEGLKNRL